ncbi:hypothetical protein QBC42DRAFT_47677 [Cladorrhinum samala]|uniref:Transmembrane protein n=1 Tax=Cladorrhinum samala TaxID=585594 RepID=A0AAV9H8E3_9PEZI|nr:hypothetical protein QBC42DRAFT_47677 [Cladorrhinum samala]
MITSLHRSTTHLPAMGLHESTWSFFVILTGFSSSGLASVFSVTARRIVHFFFIRHRQGDFSHCLFIFVLPVDLSRWRLASMEDGNQECIFRSGLFFFPAAFWWGIDLHLSDLLFLRWFCCLAAVSVFPLTFVLGGGLYHS